MNEGHEHDDYWLKDNLLHKSYEGRELLAVPSQMQYELINRENELTSDLCTNYCRYENIDLIHITTGVARANGQVERIYRIIIPIISKLEAEN